MFNKSEAKTVYAYDDTNKLIGKKILDYTDRSQNSGDWQIPGNCTELLPLTNKEGFDIVWNGVEWEYKDIEKEPEPEPPTIKELQERKIQEFKAMRDTKELAQIQIEKGIFDFDEKSIMRINEAKDVLALQGDSAKIAWTTADNLRVDMTYTDFMQIKVAGAARSNELHIKYNTLKTQVNTCDNTEELENIIW